MTDEQEQKPVLRNDGDKRYAEAKSLFDNGLYADAYASFEALVDEPEYGDRARIAAALICLEIAHRAVVEGLRQFPLDPVLLNDQERIVGSKMMLNELERRHFPHGSRGGAEVG